jgi:hypothetical protein
MPPSSSSSSPSSSPSSSHPPLKTIEKTKKKKQPSLRNNKSLLMLTDLLDLKRRALEHVRRDPMILEFMAPELRDSPSVVCEATKINHRAFQFASYRIKDDSDFIKSMIVCKHYLTDMNFVCHASNRVRSDVDLMLLTVNERGFGMHIVSPDLLSNKEFFIRSYTEHNKPLYKYASDSLWSDREFVDHAVCYRGNYLILASDVFKDDKELVLAAIENYPMTLSNASTRLRADRDVVTAAIEGNGTAIMYGHESFLDDKHLALIAVGTSAYALNFLSSRLKADFDVVKEAVLAFPCALGAADPLMRDNKEMVLFALSSAKSSYPYNIASDRLKNDKEVVMALMRCDPDILLEKYPASESDSVWRDREVLLEAIVHCPRIFWQLGESLENELKNDKAFVLACVSRSGGVLRLASDVLQDDIDVVLTAVRHDPYSYTYASPRLMKHSAEVALATIRYEGDLDSTFRRDEKFSMVSCPFSWHSKTNNFMEYTVAILDEKWRSDPYIHKAAVEARLFRRSKLCEYLLKRHRQLKNAQIAAQVDIFMLKRGILLPVKKRQKLLD